MHLTDRLHCPDCQGRLEARSSSALQCALCERTIQIVDGIVDFAAGYGPPASEYCYRGDLRRDDGRSDALLTRIRGAAGDLWPAALGDVVELGCGCGQMTRALAVGHSFRSLLVLDSAIDMARTARARIKGLGSDTERPVLFAALSMNQNAIGDAVADTVIGSTLLSGIGNTRAFLSTVQRILKPNGRALFVVPNRRYRQALCQAMAEALVQRFARDGAWPSSHGAVLNFLAHARRLLLHCGDTGLLAEQEEKHLFDSELLADVGLEVGFVRAEMIPLEPDPAGAETTRRTCLDAGVSEDAARELAGLVASAGQPFFGLLSHQDSSAAMLLWLTKASGPEVRVFNARPTAPAARPTSETVLGGPPPRWSIEILARETPDGIGVTIGGWCLINVGVLWVRITLGGVARVAPVWRPRADVHEVLNRDHLYHPLNTLCSGLASELTFPDVRTTDGVCPFRMDIVLDNGVTVSGPMPDRLIVGEQVVIAQ